MKIKSNIIFSFIFTFLLACFIIWNRFIRTRLAKDINLENINLKYLIIIFIISAIVFAYYLLTYLNVIPRPNSKLSKKLNKIQAYLNTKKWYISLDNFIEHNITNGPSNFYNFIYDYILVKPFLDQAGAKLSHYFFNYPITPYMLMFVIPKITPWIILLIEIISYQHIKYFYWSLFLLIIPLISKMLLHMIQHHAMKSIDFYKPYYDFVIKDDTLHIFFKKSEDPEIIKGQEHFSFRAGDNYEFFQHLYNITYQIKYRKELYNNILNSVVYGLMTIDFLLEIIILLN